MKIRILFLLFIFTLSLFQNDSYACHRQRRPKSCVRKVLLPGHDKPMKCNKARKIKNNYF